MHTNAAEKYSLWILYYCGSITLLVDFTCVIKLLLIFYYWSGSNLDLKLLAETHKSGQKGLKHGDD